MKVISFARNWNSKLNNKIFSTIRKLKEGGNPDYYIELEGSVFSVNLNNAPIFKARLIKASRMKFTEIPEEMIYLDTGEPDYQKAKDIFKNFYGDVKPDDWFNVLIFQRVGD